MKYAWQCSRSRSISSFSRKLRDSWDLWDVCSTSVRLDVFEELEKVGQYLLAVSAPASQIVRWNSWLQKAWRFDSNVFLRVLKVVQELFALWAAITLSVSLPISFETHLRNNIRTKMHTVVWILLRMYMCPPFYEVASEPSMTVTGRVSVTTFRRRHLNLRQYNDLHISVRRDRQEVICDLQALILVVHFWILNRDTKCF